PLQLVDQDRCRRDAYQDVARARRRRRRLLVDDLVESPAPMQANRFHRVVLPLLCTPIALLTAKKSRRVESSVFASKRAFEELAWRSTLANGRSAISLRLGEHVRPLWSGRWPPQAR